MPNWDVMLPVALARDTDLGMRDRLLYELARDLSSSLDLDVVLQKVMDRVINLMHAARGFIVLVDPATGEVSVEMAGGDRPKTPPKIKSIKIHRVGK